MSTAREVSRASFRSGETLWTLGEQWRRLRRRPSEALQIEYQWVADDLDQAVAWLTEHVRSEHGRAVDELRKQRKPKKGQKATSDTTVEDWEIEQLWQKTFGKLIRGKRIVFIPAMDQVGGRRVDRSQMWWIEKDWGSDSLEDRNVRAGARKVYDAAGVLRQEYDKAGRLVWDTVTTAASRGPGSTTPLR